jgi:hypothetical protein
VARCVSRSKLYSAGGGLKNVVFLRTWELLGRSDDLLLRAAAASRGQVCAAGDRYCGLYCSTVRVRGEGAAWRGARYNGPTFLKTKKNKE